MTSAESDRAQHLQAVLERNRQYAARSLREMHRVVLADLVATQAELARTERRVARAEQRLAEAKGRLRHQRQRVQRLQKRLRGAKGEVAALREQLAAGRAGPVRAAVSRVAARVRARRR